MANTSIDLVNLDFFSLKNSLKNYLKDNTQFKDYDYEGSNINLLMDLLSYNTHKNAFFLNMLMSEAFLDSAQLRNSVLSHAKELNYLPRSSRSARAKLKVTFEATGENAPYIIQKGSPFTTLIKNGSFVFTMPQTITVASANTTFSFTTDVYEGIYVQDTYVYQSGKENQRFKITNRNIDTRSLTVVVKEDAVDVGENYTLSTTLLDLDASSKVYFLQTNELGGYEILFGDNNIGKTPKVGSVIIVEYRISNGSRANGGKIFSCDFDPTSNDELSYTPTVEVLENSVDGAEEESLESIRYYAPRHFQIQERTITASDYAVSLKSQFPEINAVHAYGGEEITPPMFGKVFVAVDLENVDGFPDSKKREYYNFIKRKCPFSIEPVFVDPDYSYLSVKSRVRYNVNVTDLTSQAISTLVTNAIMTYNKEYLDDFNVTLRYSKMLSEIDNSHPSIISSFTSIQLYKKTNPVLGKLQNIVLNFGTSLLNNIPEKEAVHNATDVHTVTSSPFFVNGLQCLIEDNGSGKLWLMTTDGKFNQKIKDIGTLDYNNGIIQINDFMIDSYQGNALKFYVIPSDLDIISKKNTILSIESDEIDLTIEQLRE